MKKITKDTTLEKVMDVPGAQEILGKFGVPCVTCPYAKMEMDKLTLEGIAKTYGVDLDGLLKELNKNFAYGENLVSSPKLGNKK
jgi:hybrid cluster-associated redox disulfide protein